MSTFDIGLIDKLEYFAEGGAHLVLRYRSELSVIRLPKVRDMIQCGTGSSNEAVCDEDEGSNPEIAYLKCVASPLFPRGCIVIPEPIKISFEVYSALIQAVEACSLRSMSRSRIPLQAISCTALKEPDLSGRKLSPSTSTMHTLVFDIKVKCGVPSVSLFIPEERAVKRRHGRFSIMQLCRVYDNRCADTNLENGDTKPPWGDFHCVGEYDPTDLCSREQCRVKQALRALLKNPQNNLSVRLDGDIMHQHNIQGLKRFDEACSTFLGRSPISPSPCTSTPTSKSISMVDAESAREEVLQHVTNALCETNILTRLQELQTIDACLDVEGAEAVYERLVNLTGGTIAADDIVTSFSNKPLQNILDSDYCDNNEDTKMVSDTIRSYQYLQALTIRAGATREDALTWAAQLNVEECAYALHCWLAALAAKDASVILQLQSYSVAEEISKATSSGLNPNVLLRVIDIGPKPTSKIRERIQKESEICRKATFIETAKREQGM